MKTRFLLLGAATILLLACASMPPVVKRGDVPIGSEIAVVPFRDCLIPGQDDCGGSGNMAGNIVAQVFSASGKFRAVPLSRSMPSNATFTDDAAVSLAKEKGFQFVINGEVDDYYDVAPFTFRVDRAGISVRMLRVADGSVLAYFSYRKDASSNLGTPGDVIRKLAEHFRDGL